MGFANQNGGIHCRVKGMVMVADDTLEYEKSLQGVFGCVCMCTCECKGMRVNGRKM